MDYSGYVSAARRLEHLLASANPTEIENTAVFLEELEGYLNQLSIYSHHLEAAMRTLPDADLAELYSRHDFLDSLTLERVDKTLSNIAEDQQLSQSLHRIEGLVQEISARWSRLQQITLAAWRRENPRFSSMGTLDTDLQSETIKDLRRLARR